jgi:hypothetical protein
MQTIFAYGTTQKKLQNIESAWQSAVIEKFFLKLVSYHKRGQNRVLYIYYSWLQSFLQEAL